MSKNRSRTNAKRAVCVVCGEPYAKTTGAKTCSAECGLALRRENFLSSVPFGPCHLCGTEAKLTNRVDVYRLCSRECANIFRGRWLHGNTKSAAEMPVRSYPVIGESKCSWCGVTIVQKRGNKKWCSPVCRDRARYVDGRKAAADERRKARNSARDVAIGQCALCHVGHDRIIVGSEFGLTGRASAKFHRDHIVPVSRGGTDAESNLRWLCWFCNLARGSMDMKHDAAIAAAGKAFWVTIRPAV